LHKFFDRHRDALQNLHPWCFVLGPTENTPKFFNASRAEAEKQFAKYPWFSPAETRIFGGKWDPKTLPFPMSLIKLLPANPIGKIPASDIRDWDAIRTWATEIAAQLQSAV
jgi:menaquinone-dependent protoporphyrinogen oxidase